MRVEGEGILVISSFVDFIMEFVRDEMEDGDLMYNIDRIGIEFYVEN